MRSIIGRFVEDQSGATAVEYALIAGIIALGVIASVGAIRDSLSDIFTNTAAGLR